MKHTVARSFHPVAIVLTTMLFGFALPSIATEDSVEAIFREPSDIRLLLRAVQSELLPAPDAVTQDVGNVLFEPADETSSLWLRSLRSSSASEGFPVMVFENADSLDIVATNLESGSSAIIDPDPDESPLWALEPLEAFDPDVRDRLAPYFDPALVSVRFVLLSPDVALVAEPDAAAVPALAGADVVRPSDDSCSNVPADDHDPLPVRIGSSGSSSTNAPTCVAIPVVRRLFFSPSADGARLSLRMDVPVASSIVVRGTVCASGLDVRGRAGVVRLGRGAVLSVRAESDGPRRTVCIPTDDTGASRFAPTGIVSSVVSPR